MDNEILNELPYGVIVCQKNGNMLYVNKSASTILNCPSGNIVHYNILTYIDPEFTDHVKNVILYPNITLDVCHRNYIFFRLDGVTSKVFKMVYKEYENDKVLLMIYDYTPLKIEQDNLADTFLQLNINITRTNLVLKTISSICKDVLYKDRSDLKDIVREIAKTFDLHKAAICFKNGTGHIVYSRRLKDGSYESNTLEGDLVREKCFIWEKEEDYINDKELFFRIPCHQCCCGNQFNSEELKNKTLNILKLKLNNNKVVGYFEFVESQLHKLSGTDLEVLESLSQILAYIINNKEQVENVTNYIQERFSNLVPHK